MYGRWNNCVGGIYVFAKRNPITNKWAFFYVGETNSFGRRMNEHQNGDKWSEAVELGAAVVLAVVVPHESDRISLEKELINLYRPPLNTTDNPSKQQPPTLRLADLASQKTNAPQIGLLGLAAYVNI